MRNKIISDMLEKNIMEEVVKPKQKKKLFALAKKLSSPDDDGMMVYHYYSNMDFATWRGRVFVARDMRKFARALSRLD